MRPLAVAAVVALSWRVDAHAQTRVHVSTGIAAVQHRDPTASPLSYSGLGQSFALAVDRVDSVRHASLSALGALPTLSSSVTRDGYPREEVSQADFAVSLGWRVRRGLRHARLYAGPRLSFTNTYWRHVFPPSVGDEMGYLFANVALAPEVSGFTSARRGTFEYHAAMPLVALVEHPYTDARVIAREGLRLKFATLASLQQVEVALSYRQSFNRRAAWLTRYRGRVIRYSGAPEYRAAEQAFDVGVALGGAP